MTTLEAWGRAWIRYWHGLGEPHQFEFYRCKGCRRVISWKRIRSGGCDCDGSRHLTPARLSAFEKARILVLPWTI